MSKQEGVRRRLEGGDLTAGKPVRDLSFSKASKHCFLPQKEQSAHRSKERLLNQPFYKCLTYITVLSTINRYMDP